MIKKLKSAFRVLRDAQRANALEPNQEIFNHLLQVYEDTPRTTSAVLYQLQKACVSKCRPVSAWKIEGNEASFAFDNPLFGGAEIWAYLPNNYRQVLVFLPGSITAARTVLDDATSPFFLKEFCEKHSIALFVWDWPLQGARKKRSMYLDLESHAILEREYGRLMPLFGSSLWREYIEELRFCLTEIKKILPNGVELDVLGWSQGAWFAYFAPLLGVGVRRVVAAGSCASFKDLLLNGATHVHGFFYYPVGGSELFDLDDVVEQVVQSGTVVHVVFGDRDRGCFQSSITQIEMRLFQQRDKQHFNVKILGNTGHQFTEEIRSYVLSQLINKRFS